MNKQLKTLSQAVSLAVALGALAPLGAQAQPDPIQVVKNYVDTANTGDFAKTLAFYADDAVVKTPIGLYVGKEQIAKFLEQDVKTTRAAPKTWEMKEPFVINTGVVALDPLTKAGVPYVEYRTEYIITPQGKIRFFAPVPMLTAEQAAKLQGPLPAKPKIDPVKVVQAYVKTANTGNFAKTLAFYAPDAAALIPVGFGLFSGKDRIAEWLKNDVTGTRSQPKTWEARGNTVINTGLVSVEALKKLGVPLVEYRCEYVIEDGKIRFFRPTVILTPEQLAKVVAASTSK